MKKTIYLLSLLLFWSCHTEQTIKIDMDVVLHIADQDHTSPLHVRFENKTQHASGFRWTFDGGEPSTSEKKDPGTVVFTTPGEHVITLAAWNEGAEDRKTYTVRVDSVVSTNFETSVTINNYAPAQFNITNLSAGASTYTWLFEGGEPSTFTGKNPPPITYNQEGKYTIVMIADNGSATFTTHKEIEVREALDVSFQILPSFEDEDDMEAPLSATFSTRLQGVLTLEWLCEGATITNPKSAEASIRFRKAGDYTVQLNVSNGKVQKQVSQNITVKQNTNLRTHKNIRFGINTAQETIGSFYSTKLRKAFKRSEINSQNGLLTDIVFLGLNPQFTYNRFVSPDQSINTPLGIIPQSQATYFVNVVENSSIQLDLDQFNSMQTDELLQNLSIKQASQTDVYFTDSLIPRIILFETWDGRKGAILIKEIIKQGKEDSYIITDIKVQKND